MHKSRAVATRIHICYHKIRTIHDDAGTMRARRPRNVTGVKKVLARITHQPLSPPVVEHLPAETEECPRKPELGHGHG